MKQTISAARHWRPVLSAAALALLVAWPGSSAMAAPVPPPPGAPIVSPGAVCEESRPGDVGRSDAGAGMICVATPTDALRRWRAFDPHETPPVGSVYRLYVAYFQRLADAGGMYYWMGLFANGYPLGSISQGFVTSAEFQARYGGVSTPEFVRLAYLNVLGREPDPGGYDHWAHLVAHGGLSPAALMVNFSESAEFRARTGTV